MIRPSFGARHGMVNVPRSPLAFLSVVFPGQLRMAKVTVAARLAVNPIQLLFRVAQVLQLLFRQWPPKASSGHKLFNLGSVCHVACKKIRTTSADNGCPHRDLCRDSV